MPNLLDTFDGATADLAVHTANSGHVWTKYSDGIINTVSGAAQYIYASTGLYWTELGANDMDVTCTWIDMKPQDSVWLRYSRDGGDNADGLKVYRNNSNQLIVFSVSSLGTLQQAFLHIGSAFTRAEVRVNVVGDQLAVYFTSLDLGPSGDRSATETMTRTHVGTKLALVPAAPYYSELDQVSAVVPGATYADLAATMALTLSVNAAPEIAPTVTIASTMAMTLSMSAALDAVVMTWVDLAAGLPMVLTAGATLSTAASGVVVLGATAPVLVRANPGTPSITDPGDSYYLPLEFSGLSGSIVLAFRATIQPGEPPVAAAGAQATIWLRYAGQPVPGTLEIPVDANHFVEVYGRPDDDSPITDIEALNVSSDDTPDPDSDPTPLYTLTNGTLSLQVGMDDLPLLRVYPSPSAPSPWPFTWTFTERVAQPVLDVLDVLRQAPGQLSVTLTNLAPLESVTFSFPGEPSAVMVEADDSGVLNAVTVPIDAELVAGTYTLTATAASGLIATADFDVLEDPEPAPPVLPEVPEPAAVPPTPVVKWVVQERQGTTITQYHFPYNPSETTSPFAPKPYLLSSTTSPGGQALTWEGAVRAQEWSISGYVDTKAFYEKLAALVSSERRYWIADHHRVFRLVSFEDFKPTYKRSIVDGSINNWSFSYELSMLIYREKVSI